MTGPDLSRAVWHKSSYSSQDGNCVEVAITDTVVGVRDSKEPGGGMLTYTREGWREFIRKVKTSLA